MSLSPERLLAGLSGPQRLLILLAVVLAVSLLLAFHSGGLPTMLLALVGSNGLLWITRPIWLSPDHGRTRMRLASLSLVLVVATLLAVGPQIHVLLVALVAQGLLGSVPGWLLGLLQLDRFTVVALMAFTLIGVFIVNWFARDQSTMKRHPTPLEEAFPEKRYAEKRHQFCEVLRSHLRDLNLKTRWSEAHFTPLDAEVEVRSRGRAQRRVTDLMTALRSDHLSRVFVVLGDPGSGKSVALRTLAMRLLDEVPRTDRVPIYINLKEWETDRPWSEAHPPTVAALQAFILANLKERSDVFGEEFLDLYFKRMLENGRFFILLDSFDEIPGVLDVPESSWLIERLSQVISTFLAGATETRGVLASRLFRRPTLTLDDGATLEIRPFDEARIARTLQTSEYVDERLVQHLFRDRPELVPIARNPFTAALIQSYATETRGQLPENQLQLYQSYIATRLRAAGERLEQADLTAPQVIDACTAMAWTMFADPELGLEAPLSRLEARLPDYPVRALVKVLSFARLIRLGGADQERVSFVHRRFNEYFVAQGLISHPERIQLQSIPTDSQWRDALVLYCEVSDERQATDIADFCWGEVRGLADGTIDAAHPAYLRAVHSLRFLRDAFRARPECIAGFRDQLEDLLAAEVLLCHGPLSAKIALEATGLARPERIESIVLAALATRDPWLSDTALRACRVLPQLSDDLEDRLAKYINSLSLRDFLGRRKELLFSLSLSDGFSDLYRYTWWKWVDARLMLIALAMLAVTSAPLLFVNLFSVLLFWVLSIAVAAMLGSVHDVMRRPMVETRALKSLTAVFTTRRWAVAPEPIFFLRFFTIFLAASLSFDLLRHGPAAFLQHPENAWLLSVSWWQYCAATPLAAYCGYSFAVIQIIVALLLVPWFTLIGWRRSIGLVWRNLRRKKWRMVIGFFSGALVIYGLAYLSRCFDLTIVEILDRILGVIVGALLFSVMLITAAHRILYSFRDWRRASAFGKSPATDRRRIETELASLKTARARLRYVERLSEQRIKPTGTWTQGLPYRANDPASTRLAQLEERWLGLADR